MTTSQFVHDVNQKRRDFNGWYTWEGTVKGKQVELKAYKTWIQVAYVNGIKHSSPMDMTVYRFKQFLENLV
jgi:hypothetical protein